MLAVCRTVHERGYDIAAASSTALACAQWSRSRRWRVRTVGVDTDAERFVERLREELARRPYAALIPGSDASLLAISLARDRLERLTSLGLPPHAIVERVLSREALLEAVERIGLPAVRSIRCASLEQALAAARELGLPSVLKSTPVAAADGGTVRGVRKGQIVFSESELRAAYPMFRNGLMVQSHVRGDVISIGGVFAGDRLLGLAVSRYHRTWPPNGGSASFAETIAPPPGLEDMVVRLVREIGWEGIFEVEVIQSGPTSFVPIDLNARPYGSMALAGGAGAPLAAIWCDWLLGRDPERVDARPGHRYRWEDGELRYVSWQLRRRHYRAAATPLLPRRDVIHAHFQLGDPLPLLARGLLLGLRTIGDATPRAARSR
jgi:predicted ATP-grasp superfamily ATP-dependent carboligase